VALWARDKRFLGFEGCRRYSRLVHFFSSLDREGYRLLLSQVERRFDEIALELQSSLWSRGLAEESVKDFAKQVVPEDDGALIWSKPRGGISDDPNKELSRIFQRYIGQHNGVPERVGRDEGEVFRAVYRKAFSVPQVAEKIVEHEVVAPLASHVFRHAWKNGVWNVYETLSFDLLEAEAIERKAHTWYGRSVHLGQSSDNPKIHFLLGKPQLHRNSGPYDRAKAILASAKSVELIEEDQAQDFALDLSSQLSR
jgi:hypothetical protein